MVFDTFGKEARLYKLLEGKIGLEEQVRTLPTTQSLEAALNGQHNQPILVVRHERYGTDGCFSSSFLYPTSLSVGIIADEKVHVHQQADQFSPQGGIVLAEVPTEGHLYAPDLSFSSWEHNRGALPILFGDLFDPSNDTPLHLHLKPTVALERGTAVYVGDDVDRFLKSYGISWTSKTIRPLLLP